jgi:hypothetical protein
MAKSALQIKKQMATFDESDVTKKRVKTLIGEADSLIMKLQTTALQMKASIDAKEGTYEPDDLKEAIQDYNQASRQAKQQFAGYKKILATGVLTTDLEP